MRILPKLLILTMVLGLASMPPSSEAGSAVKRAAIGKKTTPAKKTVVAKKTAAKKANVVARSNPRRIAPTKIHRVAVLPQSIGDAHDLVVESASALVVDQSSGTVLYEKNAAVQVPIASITKLMTAMVVLDAKPSLTESLAIGEDDIDVVKGTRSRLQVGTSLSREEMLRLALMSSENRAASALARHFPGGRSAFVAAMNRKAEALGLLDTHFEDPTGLTPANVSSARDLTRLVAAAHAYPLIRQYSTTPEYEVTIAGRPRAFHNTNSLVNNDGWEIGLSKTGYISEAGKCLVMQAWLNNKPMIIVLLDSWGKLTRIGDANRIKRWVESASLPQRRAAG